MAEKEKFNYFQKIKSDFKTIFDLNHNKAPNQEIIDDIKNDVEFKGPNLWILIFAIIICSVGLDINSTAVIIGGMLISPLMGPILGIGLGVSRNDIDLIKLAIYNISIAIVLSIITSSIYFYISPLHKVQSELLSRTSPAFWDVLIAFAGGFAGIIAYTRKEKNNVIPGVAIATALMPPLSTAGFGLATRNYQFFWGALYLFFINSIFIAMGTYLVIRILKIRRKKYIDPKYEKRAKRIILFLVILVILPSIFTAINMVKKNQFEMNAQSFIEKECKLNNTLIISKDFKFDSNPKEITLIMYGETLDSNIINNLTKKLSSYNLENTILNIRQGLNEKNNDDRITVEKIKDNLKSDILNDIYTKNQTILSNKTEIIDSLKSKILSREKPSKQLFSLVEEIKIIYPEMKNLSFSKSPQIDIKTAQVDTIPTILTESKITLSKIDKMKLTSWLKLKLQLDTLVLIEK